jgi:hypothetical protein
MATRHAVPVRDLSLRLAAIGVGAAALQRADRFGGQGFEFYGHCDLHGMIEIT